MALLKKSAAMSILLAARMAALLFSITLAR
jgi:hypothetical protein